jgi:hypothetical protein
MAAALPMQLQLTVLQAGHGNPMIHVYHTLLIYTIIPCLQVTQFFTQLMEQVKRADQYLAEWDECLNAMGEHAKYFATSQTKQEANAWLRSSAKEKRALGMKELVSFSIIPHTHTDHLADTHSLCLIPNPP